MSLQHVGISNLRKSYEADHAQQLRVLNIAELQLRAGELTCVLGPTGCGKTTLLNVLARVDKADEGNLTFSPEPNPSVAYMFQTDLLLPWRTLSGNIAVAFEATSTPVDGHLVQGWIQQMKLEGFETAYPAALSVGMRQRAALARTLALAGDLTLLDEPLSHQDFGARLELESTLRGILRREGRVSVVVTHNIEEAVILGDRVLVMAGRPASIVADIAIRDLPEANRPVEGRRAAQFARHVQEVAEALTTVGTCA